jgi:hypothetical protein
MADQSVVGVYKRLDQAEEAVRALGDGGFPIENVSIIAQDLSDERRVHGYITSGDVATEAATTGAWVGGIFGLLVGAAFVWLPGVGPLVVVGSLASVVLGGLEGAVAGAAVTGLLGWFIGLGISQEKALKYEEFIRAGKFLLVAHGPAEDAQKAHKALTGSGAEHLELHEAAAAQPEKAAV